jgi:carbonic anhydrase
MTERLVEGFRRFQEGYFRTHRERLERLAQGQSPHVAMVACCDSRVDPAILFDAGPGDIFVIRNVANLVPRCEPEGLYHGTSAALEFAVTALEVDDIVVLGHARCGGIRALLQQDTSVSQPGFIACWMQIAEAARAEVLARPDLSGIEAQARACEQAAIGLSLTNLMSYPWIRERVARGSLALHGWYYDLQSGELMRLLDPPPPGGT